MKSVLKRTLAILMSLALVLSGVGVIPATTTEASSTGYMELTFSDFGIEDGTIVSGTKHYAIQDTSITSVVGTAFSGKISFAAATKYFGIGGPQNGDSHMASIGIREGQFVIRDFQVPARIDVMEGSVDTVYDFRITFDQVDTGVQITLYLDGVQVAQYVSTGTDTTPNIKIADATVTSVHVGQEEMSVDSVHNFTVSGDWRFNFNMNGTWPTTGDFDKYTNTSVTVTIKNASGETLATVEGSSLENYKNGSYWLLVIWGTYTKNNAPAAGDTITISSGQLAYADDANKIVNFAEETVLKYDGSNWSVYVEQTIEEMSVDSVLNFSTSSGDWRFNFNMNGTWPTTGDFDKYTNTSVTVTIKNASGETLVTVEGSSLETYKNGSYWLLAIWGTYTKSNAPTAGDTITISSGQLAYATDATKIVNFAEETVLEYDGANWSVYVEQTIEEMSVDSVLNFTAGENWRFNFNMNGTWPTTGELDKYTNTGVTVTIRNASGETLAIVEGSTLENYKNSSYWLLVIWGSYTGSNTPAEGDTITISSGQLAYESDANKIVNFAEETVLKYDGSNWSVYEEPIESEIQYTDITVTGLNINTAVSGEKWQAYFYTDAVLPGESWGVVDNQQESYTFDAEINGEATTLKVRKADGDKLLYVEIPTAQLPENAEATVTFKAGKYQSNLQSIGYQLTEDFVFYTNAYGWTTVADAVVSDVTFTLDATSPSGLTANGFVLNTNINDGVTPNSDWSARIYPAYEQGVTDDKQTLYFAGENGVFKNDVYQAVNLPMVKLSSTTYYVALADVDLAATTGDYYTISGVFIDRTTGKFIEYEPITVEWNGSEWATPTEWTDIVVNGLNINTAVSGERWQAYFYTDAVLPGEAWGIVNNKQESYTFDAEINGVATTLQVRKAGDKLLYVTIPTAQLPENAEATVTFKAGKYQSNVQSIGYQLTEDFVFYTNAYGWTTIADAVVSDVTFTLDPESPSGLTEKGFILNTNVNDGVTADSGWTSRIYPAYEKGVTDDKQTLYFAGENGVFKNGVYQAVKLPMVKLSSHTYYVGLADVDLAATTAGDYYTISGVFIDGTTGKFIEYEPITVKWNGEAWETIGTILGDKGVLHDVNADGDLDARDLVRIKRYLADATTAINAAQKDINFSGATDEVDVISLRKVLVGSIRYDSEGVVYEIPVYDDDLVIERMAYSSPAVGTLNSDSTFATQLSDAEIDAVFQEYKAAGFTLLNSEHVAVYKDQAFTSDYNKPLRVYLEAAERNGLGVIVYSDYLNAALRSDDLENGNYYNWQAVVDHMISNMSGYESFRGFMMSDELTIAYASNYQTIATYLTENYPELLLHSSQLPVTAYSGYGADALTSDTTTNNTEELAYRDYIWNFAQASGTYTYDLYPLVYSEDKIFGITVKSEHGVNDDWYRNLQYVADEVKEHNYSFTTGITLQSCMLEGTGSIWSQYERYAPTLKADIGFQVYTAMAYGMQEFNFFTYEDHFSDTTVSNAMADNAEVYAAVQAVNTEVDKFAHVFKAFSWKDTLDIADGSSASTTLSSRLISAEAAGARVFVGCMKDSDGFDGYMVANADGPRTAGTATVTLQFASATEAIVYINGEPQRVTLTDGVCTVTVGAGEGVFVIPIAGVTSTDAADYCDFIVDVESGAEPVVLQITDTQIVYAEGARTEDRLSEVGDTYWAKANKDARCYSYLTELVTATNPDLILVTGDLVYGEFDDSGDAFTDFVTYMEGLKIPWAPVFGNHEAETALGIDVYCDQLEAAEYCLFKQRELTGNGNYTVGIRQDGELKRVFFMLDSNGCGAASEASLANGHTITSVGFAKDQIEWYTETAKTITGYSRNTKLSFAFHIQLQAFADAYAKYGYTNDDTSIANPINIDLLEDKEEGDFGYLGRKLKDGWDTEYVVWNGLKELGVDSIFVGHEHCNSASVVYEGIRCQYGQKSSTYDRANFVNTSTGVITGDACLDLDSTYVPLIGGTVLPLSSDGSFNNPYIYLCENAGGNINWDDYKEVEGDVNGLQYGTDLTSSGVSVAKAEIGDAIAWECVATSQGKVFVDTSLLEGKTKFTFSVYIPEESTATMDLSDKPLFAIRVKPNESEPSMDGTTNGYIEYSTTVEDTNRKLEYGKWQTFTVDITGLSETCTEFAFNIASGNTIYLKDIVIE